MQGTWLVTLPPLLVIASVLITRRMILSFLIGIISSALIATDGNPYKALILSAKRLWSSMGLESFASFHAFTSSWNPLILLFLIMIGILIALLSRTGAALAYLALVKKRVKNKKQAQIASLILSLFFFIDDYFSALTVGSVMRPIAHLFKVSPVKMAFLTTAMASPITILSPISSWVGEIVLQLKQSGVGPVSQNTVILIDSYFVLVKAIPYMLYALFLVVGTWYIVLRNISYGPMRRHDNENTISTETSPFETNQAVSFFDFLLPIMLLIGTIFLMLLYTGDFFIFGGPHGLVEAVKNASVAQALFTGGLVSVVVSSFYFLIRQLISIKVLVGCFVEGFNLMFPSILMLTCAWALGAILKNDLRTGSYVATIISALLSVQLFPVICFLFSILIACMIGSAWATIGLMFPIIIDMLQKLLHLAPNTPFEVVPLIVPILGATVSGCVLGTQLSIISDNPIMSSASTGANHLEHVKTMAWYIIPIGIAAAVGFTIIGLLSDTMGSNSLYIAIGVGLALSIALLELGQYFFGKQ